MELTFNRVKDILDEYFKLYNYSPLTAKNTFHVLKHFNYFLIKKRISDYRDVKESFYYEYFEYLNRTKKLKKNTLHSYSIYLKRIFSILEEEEKILFNPFIRVKSPKADKNIRDKVLCEDEVNRLFSIFDLAKPLEFRNRVILEVLYGTGIRASELVNLELIDFYQEERLLLIRNGKGKKDRILPIGEHVYKYLLKYVREARKKIVRRRKTKYLFVGCKGRKLCYGYLGYIVKRCSKKAFGMTKASPHVLRHTFATHLLKSGAGLRQIQLLLGHKSLSSTQVYINLNQTHLKDEYEKYHPLENELYFDVYSREKKTINGKLKRGMPLVVKKIDR